jgi:O-antigen/teichoic acid export membrane protein
MLVRSLDSGFISYVGNKLNYLYHQDQNALREHLASAVIGIAILGIIELSIGLAVISSRGIVLLLGVPADTVGHFQSSAALLVLIVTWVLSGAYLGIVHRLQIPTGFMYQAAWWAMGFQVSQFIAIVIAAVLRFDLLYTSLLFAFVQFAIYVASADYLRRKLPAYYPWWRNGRARTGIRDLGHSMLLTASSFIQQGATNGAVMLISVLSGPAAVPVFTTVRTLTNLWTNVTSVLTAPLLPDVVRYHATGDGKKLLTISEAYWVLVGSVVNAGVLVAYPLIQPLYYYWTNHKVALDKSLLCLLLASVVLTNVGGLLSVYLNGINSLRVVLATSAVRGLFALGLGGLLYFYLGLTGFGLAIMLGEFVSLSIMGAYFTRRELGRHGVHLPFRSLVPIIISTASVDAFLIGEAFHFSLGPQLYPLALLAVTGAAVWGWLRLEPAVKGRLVSLIGDRFIRTAS